MAFLLYILGIVLFIGLLLVVALWLYRRKMTKRTIDSQGRQVLSQFEYFFDFLPEFARHVKQSDSNENPLSSPEYVNEEFLNAQGLAAPFAGAEIESRVWNVDDVRVYVWKFPMPKEVLFPLYVGFVPNGKWFSVYMLVKTEFVPWVVGFADIGRVYKTYGGVEQEDVSSEDFVGLLYERNFITTANN
ncbi:MAG: hypothetical protein K2K97_07675 [Muribaculaceae bacterium]|nr:hypothetical protein [Muribaculaceae bacterium]